MNRWDIINHFIKKNKYTRYLEIGYGTGINFHNVVLEDKTSVDRGDGVNEGDTFCKYVMPSSEFFSLARKLDLEKYDIIFIDGSHFSEDVIQDVENSLTVLAEGGIIVMHDCNPEKEEYQTILRLSIRRSTWVGHNIVHEYQTITEALSVNHAKEGEPDNHQWNGDVWKAFLKFRSTREDLKMYVVDTDQGCGVVQRGTQDPYTIEEGTLIDYNFFDKNRKHILNLISVEDFQQ